MSSKEGISIVCLYEESQRGSLTILNGRRLLENCCGDERKLESTEILVLGTDSLLYTLLGLLEWLVLVDDEFAGDTVGTCWVFGIVE